MDRALVGGADGHRDHRLRLGRHRHRTASDVRAVPLHHPGMTATTALTAETDGLRCLHEWVGVHARTGPDRPAVSADGGVTTYGELDRRSDLVAGALLDRGSPPLVATLMEPGADWLAVVLGIQKSGAAYVPLDTALPR